jgi:hypothetical protein
VDTVGVAEPARVALERVQRQPVEQLAQLDHPWVAVIHQPRADMQVQREDELVALPRRLRAELVSFSIVTTSNPRACSSARWCREIPVKQG